MGEDGPSFQPGMHPMFRFSGGGAALPRGEQLAFPHPPPVTRAAVQREPRGLGGLASGPLGPRQSKEKQSKSSSKKRARN